MTEGTVDFGATDAPMTSEEKVNAETKSGTKIHHIPTVLGAVVMTYNVPGLEKLNLTGENIADIYLGKIKKWNDPKIVKENQGAFLPDKDISVVYRTDGSGTTYIFTDYLSSVSPEAKEKIGLSKTAKLPLVFHLVGD